MKTKTSKTFYLRTTRRRSGFILVTVLMIIVILTAVLLEFNYESRLHLHSADHFTSDQQSLNCARAGLNIAIAALRVEPDISTDNKPGKQTKENPPLPVGSGFCKITVTEENGKINLNTLKDQKGNLNRSHIDQLLRFIDLLNKEYSFQPSLPYDIVPAIIDWTDADDKVTVLPFVRIRNRGAESNYYQNLKSPYSCTNLPFTTLEEINLIRGMNRDIFELKTKTKDSVISLRDYLTVHGEGKININTAPALVLQSLSEQITPALARMIVTRRRQIPFENISELRDLPGFSAVIYQGIRNRVTVQPKNRYYHVSARGYAQKARSTINAVLKRNTQTNKIDIIYYREI